MKREEYLAEWKKLSPVVITMTAKNGLCNHELGESYVLKGPYDKPPKLCYALWHVLSLYTWRAALGFPSWGRTTPPSTASTARVRRARFGRCGRPGRRNSRRRVQTMERLERQVQFLVELPEDQ